MFVCLDIFKLHRHGRRMAIKLIFQKTKVAIAEAVVVHMIELTWYR